MHVFACVHACVCLRMFFACIDLLIKIKDRRLLQASFNCSIKEVSFDCFCLGLMYIVCERQHTFVRYYTIHVPVILSVHLRIFLWF